MTDPKRDWRKIKYYPVSMEKLEQASMREAAYLIAPMNIGEDYEYFDKVKHLLDIPEPRKSLEEIQKELDDKFEELWVRTKLKFDISKQTAEYHYNKKFEAINNNFECAIKSGSFPQKLTITGSVGSYLVASNSSINWTSNTILFNCDNSVGYWDTNMNLQVYTSKKPSRIVRWFTKLLLDFDWKSK